MTQTATAPDGYGLVVELFSDSPASHLWEDGQLINLSEGFPTMAAARAMAWERYRARRAHDGKTALPPEAFTWTTHR